MTGSEFEKLYEESYKSVYWTAMSFLKNNEDAEDIVQDTFITAYQSYDSLKDKDKFLPWIKKIAANKSLNKLTRTRTLNVEDEFFDNEEALPEDFLPESILESDEKRKVIMDIIEKELSEEHRITIIMFYFNEMSTKEIAEALGIPQGTVLSRINSAKKKIKRGVEKYEKESDDKLFVMAVPFLTKLFIREAEQVPFRPMPLPLQNLPASAPAAKGAATKTAMKAASAAAKKGTGVMVKKYLIGAAALLVTGGAVAGVVHLAQNDDDRSDERSGRNETELSETVESEGSGSVLESEVSESLTSETEESSGTDVSASAVVKEKYVLEDDGQWYILGEYDEDGNVTKEYFYDGTDLTGYGLYFYDDNGVETYRESYDGDGTLETTVYFTYDDNGNLIEQINNDADGSVSFRIVYEYDGNGNVISETHYAPYDDSGVLDISDQITNEYSNGVLVSTTQYEYYDMPNTGTYTLITYTYEYDGNGLLISRHNTYVGYVDGVENDNGGTVTDWTYDYDDAGNKLHIYIDNGAVHSYEYDEYGNMTRHTYTSDSVNYDNQYQYAYW
ncbi:MAG: sigma-70 family RNA polymerase sigma factor [Clostridiales bacterium]|nr:sigma-70 family RNA polymerase sigma factor [Clostridiales bacterium]